MLNDLLDVLRAVFPNHQGHVVGANHHDVVEAENGRHAFELVQTESPDLVLSDWNMPEMTGIDLLAALRSAGIGVTFGFVTSEGSEQMRERAAAAGAAFLIAKPFTPEAFDEALRGALGVAP